VSGVTCRALEHRQSAYETKGVGAAKQVDAAGGDDEDSGMVFVDLDISVG
jgi:hypothetical protein